MSTTPNVIRSRRVFRGFALVVLVAGALVGSGSQTRAQQTRETLVGSWLETVTFPAEFNRPPLRSLVTVHADGTMVNSDEAAVVLDPPSVSTAGHGVWKPLGNHQFAYTVYELFADLAGNPAGTLKVRGVYTLQGGGDGYVGMSYAEVLDTDGNVLFSVDVTNSGERLHLELP